MQNNSLAKVHSPVVDDVLFRERLFQTLDQARKKRTVWVTGMPGSGKTTLVASYLAANKLYHGWYHIDSSDADLATFFYYLRHVVKKLTPARSSKLPLLTPEYLADITTYTRRYFEALYGMLPKGFVLVFDNYHEINSNPVFHNMVNEALMRIPEYGNVILISRTEPPNIFSRLRANSIMEIIGNEQIKFTPEETNGLVRLRFGKEPEKEAIKNLYNWTDGWVAGIILMLEQHKIQGEAITQDGLKNYQSIFDYFSAEIFDKMEPSTQDFLLRTSFFPSMTIEMANKMTGNQSSEKILTHLLSSHYFTIKHHDNTYKYHDLFREFLLLKMRGIFDQKNQIKIQRNAAMILSDAGYVEDATVLFLQSKDWAEAIKLILKHASDLIVQGRNQTLDAWLRELPADRAKKNPWLMYWFGMCRLPFNSVESYPIFEKAFKMFKENEDKNGIFMAWAGAVYSVTYQFGNYKLYDPWIDSMEKLINKYKTFPSPEIAATVTYAMLTAMVFRQPFNPKISRWVKQADIMLEKSENLDFKIQLSITISLYYIFVGDFPKARDVIAPFRGLNYSSKISPLSFITFKDLEVVYCWETVENDPDYMPLYDGLKLAKAHGIYALNPTLLAYGAGWALATGDLSLARKLLQEASLIVKQAGSFDTGWYYLAIALEAMFHKDFSTALINQKRALQLSFQSGSINQIAINYIQMSQILHALSEDKKALSCLLRALKFGAWSNHIKYMYLIIRAQIALDQGKEKSGLMFLRKAMQLGQNSGYMNFPGFIPSNMAKLCLQALDAGINKEYVRSLIKQRNLFPDTPPYECKDWPWAFKVFTLGRQKLFIEDKLLEFNRKAQKKPLEFLLVLIAYGGEDVSEEHIIDALWKDADGDRAKHAFETTLHRLRKLLGNDQIIVFNAGRLTLNKRYCWVDTWAIEHLLDKTETLLKNHPVNTGVGSLKRHKHSASGNKTSHSWKDQISSAISKILSLYHGPFLGKELSYSWEENYRERLQRRFLNILEETGQYFETNGEWKAAIEYYNKGLEVDHLKEIFYQRLMTCHIQLGRKAEAMSIYHSCCKNLEEGFGIEPSDITKTIYTSLQMRQ